MNRAQRRAEERRRAKGIKLAPSEPTTTPEERFREMMAVPPEEHTMAVEVTNKYGASVNGGGRGLSPEGMEKLQEAMLFWVGSRMQQRLEAGHSVPRVKVTIKVEMP